MSLALSRRDVTLRREGAVAVFDSVNEATIATAAAAGAALAQAVAWLSRQWRQRTQDSAETIRASTSERDAAFASLLSVVKTLREDVEALHQQDRAERELWQSERDMRLEAEAALMSLRTAMGEAQDEIRQLRAELARMRGTLTRH